MASKKIEKDTTEFQMFREFWMLCQKHYVPEPESDNYHEAVMRDVAAFVQKYDTPWGKAMGQAVLKAIHMIEQNGRTTE